MDIVTVVTTIYLAVVASTVTIAASTRAFHQKARARNIVNERHHHYLRDHQDQHQKGQEQDEAT